MNEINISHDEYGLQELRNYKKIMSRDNKKFKNYWQIHFVSWNLIANRSLKAVLLHELF